MHTASLWQITLATDPTFLSPVESILTTVFLTTLPAVTGLIPLTSYLSRVKYYDDMGNESPWSASVPFTTLAADTVPPPGTFLPATQGCGDCD